MHFDNSELFPVLRAQCGPVTHVCTARFMLPLLVHMTHPAAYAHIHYVAINTSFFRCQDTPSPRRQQRLFHAAVALSPLEPCAGLPLVRRRLDNLCKHAWHFAPQSAHTACPFRSWEQHRDACRLTTQQVQCCTTYMCLASILRRLQSAMPAYVQQWRQQRRIR